MINLHVLVMPYVEEKRMQRSDSTHCDDIG